MEYLDFYKKAKNLWLDISTVNPFHGPSHHINTTKDILNLFSVGSYYYYFFDIKNIEFDYISQEITTVLGYEQEGFRAKNILENIHPDDMHYFLKFEEACIKFFRQIGTENFSKYKVQYDFRVKCKDGQYKRILHQIVLIDYSYDNEILRSFGVHTDITHFKKDGTPILSFIGIADLPSYFDVFKNKEIPEFVPQKSIFTKREKEIMSYIIHGVTSKEIAQKLHLSIHTINAHRKNILQKSGCKTVAELIKNCIDNTWV